MHGLRVLLAQVALIDDGACVTPLFIINRSIDIFFCSDVLLTLNTAYQDANTGRWITSRSAIAKQCAPPNAPRCLSLPH